MNYYINNINLFLEKAKLKQAKAFVRNLKAYVDTKFKCEGNYDDTSNVTDFRLMPIDFIFFNNNSLKSKEAFISRLYDVLPRCYQVLGEEVVYKIFIFTKDSNFV